MGFQRSAKIYGHMHHIYITISYLWEERENSLGDNYTLRSYAVKSDTERLTVECKHCTGFFFNHFIETQDF